MAFVRTDLPGMNSISPCGTGSSPDPDFEWGDPKTETPQATLARIRRNNERAMQRGVKNGWWESVDAKGNPVPFPIIIKISQLEPNEKTMAHVFTKAKVFDSVGEAKRAGWKDKPITEGEFWFNKRTVRVQIIS